MQKQKWNSTKTQIELGNLLKQNYNWDCKLQKSLLKLPIIFETICCKIRKFVENNLRYEKRQLDTTTKIFDLLFYQTINGLCAGPRIIE